MKEKEDSLSPTSGLQGGWSTAPQPVTRPAGSTDSVISVSWHLSRK